MKRLLLILLSVILIAVPCNAAHWPLDVGSVSVGAELVTNGTMEADASWGNSGTPTTNEQSVTQTHGGSYARKFIVDAEYEGIRSDGSTTVTGVTYTVTAWVYPDDSQNVHIAVKNGDDSVWAFTQTYTNLTQDAWNEITFEFTETAGGANCDILFRSRSGETSGTWYVDDVSVKPKTTTDLDPSALTATLYGADLRNHGGYFTTDDIVTVADNANISITGDMTVFASLKPDDGQPAESTYVVNKYSTGSGERTFAIVLNTAGKINVYVSQDGTTVAFMQTDSAVFSDGVQTDFTDIGFVYNASGQNIDIYVNGIEVASTLRSGTIPNSLKDNDTAFAIGARSDEASYYAGLVADVYVYGSCLTAANMLSAYQGNPPDGAVAHWPLDYSPRDHTGNGNDGTASGCVFIGEAMYLNGSDASAQFTSTTFNPQDIGISFRAKRDTTNADRTIIGGADTNKNYIVITSGGNLTICGNNSSDYAYGPVTPDTHWHHYVINSTSGTIAMYEDGSAISMTDSTLSETSFVIDNLGERGAQNYMDGYIADPQIRPNRPFSTSEITALYKAGPQGMRVETGRPQEKGYWPLTLGSQTVGSELVTDGTMETWVDANNLTQWGEYTAGTSTINREGAEQYAGTYAARLDIDGSDSNAAIYTGSAVFTAGQSFYLSMYAKSSAGTPQIVVAQSLNTTSQSNIIIPVLSTTYTKYDSIVTGGGTYDILINRLLGGGGASKSLYIDNVSLKALLSADLSAYSNHAQAFISDYSGSVTSAGTEFDGTDDYYKVPDNAAIQNIFDGGGWIEAIIDVDSDGGGNAGRIASKRGAGNNAGWVVWVDEESGGQTHLNFILDKATDGRWTTTSLEINNNEKTHIIVVYDSSTQDDPIFQVNGEIVALTEESTPAGSAVTDVGSDLIIGASDPSDGLTREFDGHIKMLRMGKGMIDALQAKKMYKDSKGDM